MLVCSYPCTATDAWSRIIDALQRHGTAGVVPSDPVRDVTPNAWTFQTTIEGLTAKQELLLVVKFLEDKDLTVRQT
jgi:hypothetical protein